MKNVFIFFLLLTACSPHSMEDFHHEGDALCRKIAHELKQIETGEELMRAIPKLKTQFNQLVELMIEARRFQYKSEEVFDPISIKTEGSRTLLAELKRVYQIETGRELIEKAQKEALLKLDAFERKNKTVD